MKSFIVSLVLVAAAVFFSGCGKKNLHPKQAGVSGYSFANTEWTGVAGTVGQTYQQPCYLHFEGDTGVVVYALFDWYIGNDILAIDSSKGSITAVDTSVAGTTKISVYFPYSKDQQVYMITNGNTITGGSTATSTALNTTTYTVNLQLCPPVAVPVDGTSWTTDIITGGGSQVDGRPSFPDLATLSFDANNKMTYYRNGQPVTYTPPTQDQLLIEGYLQKGFQIYFAGYNEQKDLLIQYYGVLTPDGEMIFADTRASRSDARLPSYIDTFNYYGFPGITPTMHKAH